MYSGDTMWASTDILGVDYDKATNEAFFKLFDYISGDNELSTYILLMYISPFLAIC